VKGPTPRRLWRYVTQRLRLGWSCRCPGDGRRAPHVPAEAVVWGLVIGHLVREGTFAGVEALVRSDARATLGVARGFSDDTLAYVTERLDPEVTRRALGAVVRQAKRNKAFSRQPWVGLALDGTRTRCVKTPRVDCSYCHPVRTAEGEVLGFRHHVVMVRGVGVGVTVPCDAELYGPGDSEQAAGQRCLARVVGEIGRRCADYVVADGAYATAPFLHAVGALGLHAVVRLKDNVPSLREAAERRYAGQPPTAVFTEGRDRVEVWDEEDFDPWEALCWTTVRVFKYRQTTPEGRVIEALWLSDWPKSTVPSHALYRMAKSRWEIENETFNVAKTAPGREPMCHPQGTSLLVRYLILLLTMAIERLYRLRWLHRGKHPVRSAIALVRTLRLSLGRPFRDTS